MIIFLWAVVVLLLNAALGTAILLSISGDDIPDCPLLNWYESYSPEVYWPDFVVVSLWPVVVFYYLKGNYTDE